MKMLRSCTAIFAACLTLVLPLTAIAAERTPDTTPANGKPGGVGIVGGWDGASWRAWATDPSGIGRVTEEYPPQMQTEVFIAATTVPLTTGLKQIGNGWTVHPHGNRVLRIRRVGTGGAAVDRTYFYLYGSDDNTNFYPLVSTTAVVAGSQAAADTALVDTLRISLPSSPATLEMKIALPEDIYPGRYLAVYGKRDSTASTAQTISLTFEGRWK